MKTVVYMVRHCDSPKLEADERSRGLTDKGKADVNRITELLKGEEIEVFVSSPYKRAILTIEELAQQNGKEIIVFEDLKERIFSNENNRISDDELFPLLEKSFSVPNFSLDGAESNVVCQDRAITTLKQLLDTYRGQKIAVGTHGLVMTLMMGYYDNHYDLDFLLNTTKPDVYKMEFNDQTCVGVKRLWKS
ncbi:histidine phosphatase family protein [Bacillus solimangrovi]|uniref:Phosphoglycerate mutase n=1 Tax=Bacillus solimangrovi TaxID=1305675 RepID=A0A1E5LJY4_9BACI|nr:histidine phosphatase family protein [Bacillus solimangrovi]OEH94402.1 phosphoglycerate mutase [Bacillus solimangrovi]